MYLLPSVPSPSYVGGSTLNKWEEEYHIFHTYPSAIAPSKETITIDVTGGLQFLESDY